MSANQMPRPVRRLPVGWATMLAFDFLATLLAALVLCTVGLLLPGITEDYGPDTGPTSPRALAFFIAALVLLSSLAVTTGVVSRTGTESSRTLALWLSAARLGLLVLSAAAFITYGIVTIEPA
ncbi:hypothetical protein WKI68_38290 [Streptomyces sp. MS1.HAVA.3]|uniref:Integral membrane protein n=1 Tax=Streptomyces caledonius TaxID=3134107 RepID=A0ABU8UCA7_9ACTN